ncbi:MAG: adenylate/guanylate cyclase domain-containing protein [Acidobacteriia bacterium]|nr:adenylate/guanylate cyclase domain-containing protein [Terriglobia bacterium]
MAIHWRNWAWGAAIAAGGVIATQLLSTTHFVQLLNLKAYDAQFLLRGRQPVSNVLLVVADEKTLNTFPELQAFWHPYYADAIRGAAAGGAKVVAFDVAFGIPVTKWAPDADQILAEAVSTSPVPAIIGYVPALMAKQRDWPVPVNMIAGALGLAAFANLTVDSDDFVRRQELIEAPAPDGGPQARSFALKIAEKFTGEEAKFERGRLSLHGRTIPISEDRAIAVDFAGPADTFPRVSLSDFLAAYKQGNVDQLKKWVEGKAVLVGPDNVEDRYPTPFYTAFSSVKWTTAGVEIHANTLETILNDRYLLPLPAALRLAALLLIGLMTVTVSISFSVGRGAAAAIAALLLAFGVAEGLFYRGWVLSDAELTLCWLTCLVATIVYRFAAAEKRRDLFRRAVSLFVGKQLATTLDDAQQITLTGTRQTVTILFTDIRGFTAFCEEKDPAVVVDLLNEYMRTMVAIVVKYRGHVNKFIGDGILAVFSDEDGSTPGDHGMRAVQCAVEMVTVPGRFQTGAGLHSGPVVVGNVGSEDKMEYTVLGDTVNLASRLESLNKENKTRLLMSGSTYELLGGRVETKYLGPVPVRGKAVPIDLHTVASLMAATAGAEHH